VPSFPDTETTFDELQARIAKTLEFIESFKPEQIDGSDDKAIVLTEPGEVPRGPVLLVASTMRTGWTITVAAARLRDAGATDWSVINDLEHLDRILGDS